MGEDKVKVEIIPQKILDEVALRKKFAEDGIQVFVSRKRQWGSRLANALLNDTVDAEVVSPKELPNSTTYTSKALVTNKK